MSDIDLVVSQFREWAEAEGLPLGRDDIQVESLGVPHRPTALRTGWQGVYAFRFGATWLKVGKAGPNSKPRWTSQHYGPNRALSTLAWSLLTYAHLSSFQHPELSPDLRASLKTVHPEAIGEWIKKNTARVNICIRAELGRAALGGLERIALSVLRPVFEGRWDPGAAGGKTSRGR